MFLFFYFKIDLLDIFTLLISFFALFATLRKKEFGKFYFVPKDNPNQHVWIKVMKSDIYDLKFTCEPYTNMIYRIDFYHPEIKDDNVIFRNEVNPTFEIGLLTQNTTVKFSSCKSSKIQVEYSDKYNNKYIQIVTQEKISKRRHKNFWNLTFVGS